jgi:predicted DNA binding CopG/RHH family protein
MKMNDKRFTVRISQEIIKTIKKMAIDYGMSPSRFIEHVVKKEEEIKNK